MKVLETLWWIALLRGVALLLLGVLAISWPGITLIVLAYIFAFYVLMAGIINVIHGIYGITQRRSWFLSLILGLIQIGVSIYVLRVPALTLATFILLVGFAFLMQGVLEIIIAFVEQDLGSRVIDIIGGILAIVAGFFILRYPISGGIAFVWVMGVYGLVVGSFVIAVALGFRREMNGSLSTKIKKRLAL
ncbi:MAG TPA: DUF308 domain-containing protein [Patescibacteria group bacterium]|nr:DUF308 domain-containing protein [Patescibacteria group bacterium]